MRYLFFDQEFATSKGGNVKICEFGYVITDENFNVIKRDNLIIDPYILREEWDWRVVRKILHRKVKEYESKPRFNEYYYEIKDLIESADYVFGHSLNNDVKALNCECKRYNLPSIDFEFYDVKYIYRELSGTKKEKSLEALLEEFKVEGEDALHDAECDAYDTMLVLKKIVEDFNTSVKELIDVCPTSYDVNKNYECKSLKEAQIRREEKIKELSELEFIGDNTMFHSSMNRIKYVCFLDNIIPNPICEKIFEGKKISISYNYEQGHYKECLNLAQMVADRGGTIKLKASESDIVVNYDLFDEDGNKQRDTKVEYAQEAINNGAHISIISLDENKLKEMPVPSFECLYKKDAIIKNKVISSIVKYSRDIENRNEKSILSQCNEDRKSVV